MKQNCLHRRVTSCVFIFAFCVWADIVFAQLPQKFSPLEKIDPSATVVKIFVTSNKIDFKQPWQSRGLSSGSGSGCIIEGNRILTNAHVVADHTYIQVRKKANPKKYTAQVLAIAHDCDLALLTVDDPAFFEGIEPLKLGHLPQLQDTVTVMGYPLGGDKLSITEGVVSRIEIVPYVQSSRKLLGIQIDAAINPGNSGGPVLQNGKLIGIAMQIFTGGQNIGYMIPVPIIQHFFDDLADGSYDGFPIMGIEFDSTENPSLRKFYQAQNLSGGIVITTVLPFSPAQGHLYQGDIVLEIDGVSISEDGTFAFKDQERLFMPYLITAKQIDEKIRLKVLRDGQLIEVYFPLTQFDTLVPHPRRIEPAYYIYGGILFTVLSTDLLLMWGDPWVGKAPPIYTYYIQGNGRLNERGRKEIVVILKIFPDDINVGYHGQHHRIVSRVNNMSFRSFREFVILMENIKAKEETTIIQLEDQSHLILENKNIDKVNQEILERNNIPNAYPDIVSQWLEKK